MNIENFFIPSDKDKQMAFLQKSTIFNHGPEMNRETIVGPLLNILWKKLSSAKATSMKRAIYVHIPFCLSRCAFCSFYANATKTSDLDEYTDLVIQEMQISLKESPELAMIPIDIVYFGGGTPTDLSKNNLQKIISFILINFKISPQVEFTVEGRLFGFNQDKIESCIENGANRFSFGVQTFDTAFRRRFGRRMTQEEVCEHLSLVKKIGGDKISVNLDLIYGLPGQSKKLWDNDMNCIQNTNALDGVDLYRLKLLPGTVLTKENNVVSFEECFDHFSRAKEFLIKNNWRRLSMTHWGRTTKERNLYNHGAKTGIDILPFGAGAGGMLAGYRIMQVMDLKEYKEAILAKRKALQVAIPPSPDFALMNLVTHQTELGFIDFSKYPIEFVHEYKSLWENWQKQGFISEKIGNVVHFTTMGEYWNTLLATLLIGAWKQWKQR